MKNHSYAHYIHTYSSKVKILSSAYSLNYLSSTKMAFYSSRYYISSGNNILSDSFVL